MQQWSLGLPHQLFWADSLLVRIPSLCQSHDTEIVTKSYFLQLKDPAQYLSFALAQSFFLVERGTCTKGPATYQLRVHADCTHTGTTEQCEYNYKRKRHGRWAQL